MSKSNYRMPLISKTWGPDAFTSDDEIAERIALDEADCLQEIAACGSIQGGHGAFDTLSWLALEHGWNLVDGVDNVYSMTLEEVARRTFDASKH